MTSTTIKANAFTGTLSFSPVRSEKDLGRTRSKDIEKMSLLKAIQGTMNHVAVAAIRPVWNRNTKRGLSLNKMDRNRVKVGAIGANGKEPAVAEFWAAALTAPTQSVPKTLNNAAIRTAKPTPIATTART